MKLLKRTLAVLLCMSMLFCVTLNGESVFSEWIRENSFKAYAATTETFYVAFDTRGGNDMSYQSGSGWITITSEVPKKRSYIFLGWSLDETGTTADRQPGDSVYLNEDIVFYALWLYNENPAQGDVNGDGSITIIDYIQIQKYVNGENNLSASEIGRADFNRDGIVNENDYIAVMQAINNETRYVLTYNSNGGNSVPQSQSGSGSVTITSSVPTKRGYSFAGWSTYKNAPSAQYQPGGSFSLTQDRILYAVWVENEKPTGSISSTNTVAASQTVTLSLSDNDAVAGYYWGTSSVYTNNAYTATSFHTVTKTVSTAGTYYLTVKDRVGNLSNTVSITFYKTTLNANGGTITPASVLTASGKSFTLPTPTRSDYTFSNWNTASGGGGTAYSGVYMPTKNATLYAVWIETGRTVVYDFSANGGTSATKTSAVVEEGSMIDLSPVAEKSGWDFVGWNTNVNATTKLSSLNMGSVDVTLYAIFKKTLTGTFVDYNGTAKATRTASVTIYNNASSGTVTAPAQNVYTGWTKCGWSTGTSANASAASIFSIMQNTTFYGLYRRTLTLSYNANGGSSTPSSQTGTQYANSYAISSYKNPSFTLAGAISKSEATFIGWAEGSTSGSLYNAGSSISISENTTMFATWKKTNIYNLGEETYRFGNYADYHGSRKVGGHCFGMSATSAGYYLNRLDPTRIGISSPSMLYTVTDSSQTRKNICYYQDIQEYRERATVAGGSWYLTGVSNLSSDWNQVVNYVKDHSHDGNGDLQIGFRGVQTWPDGSIHSGGHAINFLRYEVVNGQERVYAYDNNFPTIETYFYMSNGQVEQAPENTFDARSINCIALRDVNVYFNYADSHDSTRFIYGYDSEIKVEEAKNTYIMEMDSIDDLHDGEYVMFEIESNVEEVTVTPLVENAVFSYCNHNYAFGRIDDDTCGILTLVPSDDFDENAAIVDEEVITDFAIKNAPSEKQQSITIKNYVPSRTEDYRTTITFSTVETDIPSGETIHWFVNGDDSGIGQSFTVTEAKSSFSVQAKLIARDGKVLAESEKETVTIKTGFFARLKVFFRALFGKLPKVVQEYLGVEVIDRDLP